MGIDYFAQSYTLLLHIALLLLPVLHPVQIRFLPSSFIFDPFSLHRKPSAYSDKHGRCDQVTCHEDTGFQAHLLQNVLEAKVPSLYHVVANAAAISTDPAPQDAVLWPELPHVYHVIVAFTSGFVLKCAPFRQH